jgi:predicted amidohydrolase YtcJ
MKTDQVIIMQCYLPILFLTVILSGCGQDSDQTPNQTPILLPNQTSNTADSQDQVTAIINARIVTVSPQQPRAQAMTFDADGVILAIADNNAIQTQFPQARLIDLNHNGVVIPGLIDAHGHIMGLGFALLNADLVATRSVDEIIQRLQQHAEKLPPEAWLLGRGWDQNDWVQNASAARFPTRADLDQAFPDRPVWLQRIDGHAGWANSAALARLDAAALQTDPDGGQILRDEQGQPSGVFIDAAAALVDEMVPPPTTAMRERALQLALEQLSSYGLTGVHDAGTSLEDLQLYQQFIAQQQMPLRIYAMADGDREALNYLCSNGALIDTTGLLQARAVKMYLDGALGSRGAAMMDDYSDQPGHRGLLFADVASFTDQVADAMRCGLQVNTHAIGDRANEVLLDAYAAAMQQVPDHSGRHRIEHAQIVRAEHYQRAADLGLIASMQPTHATSDMYWAEQRVGPQRILHGYAWKNFTEAQVRLALGSDFPVESAAPLRGLYAAISRQDAKQWPADGWYPEQRLSREQALHGFTLGAAYAAFMEDQVGSLEVGKRADFVWLSADIMSIEPARILSTEVLATWVDGKQVYTQRPVKE